MIGLRCLRGCIDEFFERKNYRISNVYNKAFAQKYAKCIEKNPGR